MSHIINKYACDHCGREYKEKRGIEQHEPKCFYLPENRACVTCAHLIAWEDEYHTLEGGYDIIHNLWKVECDIELDYEYLPGEEGGKTQAYQAHCDGWVQRTVKGTYKFGKTKIEQV